MTKIDTLIIRRANSSDLMTYFEWVNDDFVRINSFNSELITIENHINWFNLKLNSEKTVLFIAEIQNIPVAQVRFDLVGDELYIDYSVSNTRRGEGLGVFVLRKSIEFIKMGELDFDKLIGKVKIDNIASQKIFRKLGFSEIKSVDSDIVYYLPNIVKL